MEKGKSGVKLPGVILAGLAAVIWTVNCIVLAVYAGGAGLVRAVLVVDIVCAVIWWVVTAGAVYSYRKGRAAQR